MVGLIKALQIILALSVLILVHELGHFLFAKLFKIRVEKFYLFFDVGGKALLRFKPKNSETEYGIGWLPLGGYCKISGMIDESMDTESMAQEPKPWEFRAKPAWQRLLVMAGGVLFNFIFAALMFTIILATWGEPYISNDNKQIYVNNIGQELGFRNGDHIISFDDYVPDNFFDLQADLARRMTHKAVVLRGGDTVNIYMDKKMLGAVLKSRHVFNLALPFVVDTIMPGAINAEAGLIHGDKILAIDGQKIEFVQDALTITRTKKDSTVVASILRGGDTLQVSLAVNSNGRFDIYPIYPGTGIKTYSFAQALLAGPKTAYDETVDCLRDLRLVASPETEAYKSVGSVISMADAMPSMWDWHLFTYILGMLSIMLAVMNMLPIPALDGGHMVFTLYEIITRRKPSDKFMIVMQMVGMIIIFGLMILAFGNDILRLISK